ncbi:MAG: DMT family transporter, partial [candidate division Zixibacteria bacterium]|nr:DMT family transporter [candidate division Zixibacteria bacterium]
AVTSPELALLFLSGIIGLTIGDYFYFSALKEMGPRQTTQLFALHPVASTIIAWFVLSERLSILTLLGICVAIVGTILVASERRRHEPNFRPATLKAILYTVFATVCHAVGFVIAKYVMATKMSTLTGGFLRMFSATVAIWIGALIAGQLGSTVRSLSTPLRIKLILGGSILGPTLGVWAALEGITHTEVGVASTLIALTPILVIPLVAIIHKERLSARAIIGALIAFLGVAIIFVE